ncbi:GlcG/HbpS family heme-binding protein [Limimaricola litoreus]|uniref:Heme-binding protein n=1 Tax=Limimaricola litoreus TaxID=2955316 RepID=A0A9X2FSZ8_9RHOB|nr:heme-binding protein [Limimaricola litoreus]MCP1166973.1 heme-binding protein [Limimaricola litoreus]
MMPKLTIDAARTIIRETLAKGHEMGLKPLSVIVLDAGGHPLAFEREDGAAPGRYVIAEGKAYGAVMLGMPGSAQMARAEAQHYFMTAANGAFGGKVVPVPGGVILRGDEGEILGGVGVTGDTSDNDAEAALAGIAAAGLKGEA